MLGFVARVGEAAFSLAGFFITTTGMMVQALASTALGTVVFFIGALALLAANAIRTFRRLKQGKRNTLAFAVEVIISLIAGAITLAFAAHFYSMKESAVIGRMTGEVLALDLFVYALISFIGLAGTVAAALAREG